MSCFLIVVCLVGFLGVYFVFILSLLLFLFVVVCCLFLWGFFFNQYMLIRTNKIINYASK